MTKVLTGSAEKNPMAAPKGKQKPGVKLEDLQFYFDGVERERLDSAGWSRRSAEVLDLRDKLLQLAAPAYEAAISTMRNVVASKPPAEDAAAAARDKQKAQGKLFQEVQGQR
jgi:hypothetical protein